MAKKVSQPDPTSVMSRFITAGERMHALDNAFRYSPTEENALNAIEAWQEFVRSREAICGYVLDQLRGVSVAS